MTLKWDDDKVKILTDNYGKISNEEIAKLLNTTKSSINCKITRLGLNKQKDKGNIRLFQSINNELSAYWLGFIYADGYIFTYKDSRGSNYELGIELNIDDITHLEKFNVIFNNYYKITTRKRSMNTLDMLNNNEISNRYNHTCLIRIYSKEIVNDLLTNNIVQNKTNSEIFPIINDKKMFLHFLRGYIDGDGTYLIDTKNRFRITIQGNNKQCFEFISKKLKNDFDITSHIFKDRECWKLYIGCKQDVLKLIDLMFNDANVYLDRKYQKIIEIKNAVHIRNDMKY